jgi:hypothetical protein
MPHPQEAAMVRVADRFRPPLTRRQAGALMLPVLLGGRRALARTPARPIVVELFTSEGCSSCPPAEALLRRLAVSDATLLPLAFHVTYWDRLGWRDPFSLPAATARQRAYARHTDSRTVYTPQMIIDGRYEAVGSDERAVGRALRAAAAGMPPPPPLRIAAGDGQVVVELGAAAGLPPGTVLLLGYDREHRSSIGRGENTGLTLLEANIVRALVPLGTWRGEALRLQRACPAGERLAVLVQAGDGAMLAAATAM